MASVVILGCTNQSNTGEVVLAKEETVTVKVLLEKDGEITEKEVEMEKGSNGLDAVKKAFRIEATEYATGSFVNSINGITPEEGYFWGLYVNGEFAEKAIDLYEVKEGMEIKWKYTRFEEAF